MWNNCQNDIVLTVISHRLNSCVHKHGVRQLPRNCSSMLQRERANRCALREAQVTVIARYDTLEQTAEQCRRTIILYKHHLKRYFFSKWKMNVPPVVTFCCPKIPDKKTFLIYMFFFFLHVHTWKMRSLRLLSLFRCLLLVTITVAMRAQIRIQTVCTSLWHVLKYRRRFYEQNFFQHW